MSTETDIGHAAAEGKITPEAIKAAENMIGILMTQRMMESPTPPKVSRDFWTGAYQAFND